MIWPPSVLRVEWKDESKEFHLWLPLFMAWPFVLLAGLVLAPVVLALAIAGFQTNLPAAHESHDHALVDVDGVWGIALDSTGVTRDANK